MFFELIQNKFNFSKVWISTNNVHSQCFIILYTVSNTSRTTNSTKSRVFQKLPVIMTSAVIFSTAKISDDEFIKNVQCLIGTEHGRGMISRGVYGK